MDRVTCAEILAFFGSYRLIQMVWEWIDMIEYGAPVPSVADTIAAMALSAVISARIGRLLHDKD